MLYLLHSKETVVEEVQLVIPFSHFVIYKSILTVFERWISLSWCLQAGKPLVFKEDVSSGTVFPHGSNKFSTNVHDFSSLFQIPVRRSRNYANTIPSAFRTTMEGQSVFAMTSVPRLKSPFVEQTVRITLMSVS